MNALLQVSDLRVTFRTDAGPLEAVRGLSFGLSRGETLCILGESGSGKSVALRALMRLHPPRRTTVSGQITLNGTDVLSCSEAQMGELRNRTMAMIFQEPMSAMDPVFTIGSQIAETVRRVDGCSAAAAHQRSFELLNMVRIPRAIERMQAYPHELSGGLRQRAMIAMALAGRPSLLLADEPTTALDATVQIQILALIKELQAELGMAVIFVTHDMGVAEEIADRLLVMYSGQAFEQAPVERLMDSPAHPYTRALIRSTVKPGMRGERLYTIPGHPGLNRGAGCPFAPRCPEATALCHRSSATPVQLGADHAATCHNLPPEVFGITSPAC